MNVNDNLQHSALKKMCGLIQIWISNICTANKTMCVLGCLIITPMEFMNFLL